MGRKALTFLEIAAGCGVLVLYSCWALPAMWFWTVPRIVSAAALALYVGGIGFMLVRWRPFRKGFAGALGICAAWFLVWQLTMRASNDRDWLPDVRETAYAEIDGSTATVHNVRNCEYRSETEYDVRYETRTYDLDTLAYVDMYLVDWGLGAIAHTMLSFGFEDGRYLCFSFETRKEQGEAYSAVKGFFRQYEIICVAGDERDLVGLRTNHRKGEDVYLYRLRPKNPAIMRPVFVEYLHRLNELHARAEWYNAVTDNCMTGAYKVIRKHAEHASWNWRILLNGHAPELAYMEGTVFNDMPFAELKAASRVNAKATATAPGEDFSAAIRRGVPGIEPSSPPGQ